MNPIRDYAMLGDGRSAALVSKEGSIDWLCWPRFDSPSIFGRLLDPRAGHWSLAPAGLTHAERRYLPQTAVLETRLDCATGTLVVHDVMPVTDEAFAHATLVPEHEVLRVARCVAGEVELVEQFAPRPGFSLAPPRARDAGHLGVRVECPEGLLLLASATAPRERPDGVLEGRRSLRAGEHASSSLVLAVDYPAVVPSALGPAGLDRLEESVQWWRRWTSQLQYAGPARAHVERSGIVLKQLTYAPSGAVVAAPTTSLPERLGADLNWDYRYCWLRDAALTTRALFGLGYHEEARSFVSWLLHATRLTRPRLRTLYDVHGNRPPRERALDALRGYEDSRPVRLGNAAMEQVQLDIYGEVVNAVATFVRSGNRPDRETRRMLVEFGEYVCAHGEEPDQGIWEPREPPRPHTNSRLLCWSALDQLLALEEAGLLPKLRRERYEPMRARLRADIEQRAWNPALASYVGELDGDQLDASTLLMPWYGFHAAQDPRMRATYARLRERLGAGDGLLYRTGPPGREGAFGVCSFWSAEYLAQGGGTLEEARALFDRLLEYANDVGLFSEAIEPHTGAALGNFPQAFTHIGLINAALTLEQRRQAEAGAA